MSTTHVAVPRGYRLDVTEHFVTFNGHGSKRSGLVTARLLRDEVRTTDVHELDLSLEVTGTDRKVETLLRAVTEQLA